MTAKAKCVHCGEPVNEWTHECPKCGRPVANLDAPIVKPLGAMKAGSHGKKSILPYVIVVLAIIIIAGIFYFSKM